MTCDICRESFGENTPPCGECFPGLQKENQIIIEAVSRFGPMLGNGMGGVNFKAALTAVYECGGDMEDVELLGHYLSYLREARDEAEADGKQTDQA